MDQDHPGHWLCACRVEAVLKSLRGRNLMLMAAVLFAGQALTTLLVALLVIWPQADRVAGIIARNVSFAGVVLDALPADQRGQFVARVNATGSFRIQPGYGEPPGVDGRPTWLETAVLRALADDLDQRDRMVWRGGGGSPLWVRLELGRQGYFWVSLAPSAGWSPNGALLGAFAIGLVLSLIGGLALQRRINTPLRAMGAAIDAMPDTREIKALSKDAPAEIANMAQAFDRMAARLAAEEADRSFMLAGISHDLKTPIAKLRIAAEMVDLGDQKALVERQFERLDAMLGQFLDFGRGTESEPPAIIDPAAAIEAVIDALGIRSETRIIKHATDCLVFARPVAFDRAITNLLRNAGMHGGPPIEITIADANEGLGIAIRDHGPGAPPALLERLGRPFLRGDAARPSDGSVGLGLAIASRFAADNGGSIAFANRPEGGFEALLTLPRPVAAESHRNRQNADRSNKSHVPGKRTGV